MPRFINVPERRTCRYDSALSPAEIEGLYTDNFSECNIIIFYTQIPGRLRVSMIHADRYVERSQIKAELIWLAMSPLGDWEGIVVAKKGPSSVQIREKLLGPLLPHFKVKIVEDIFAVSFGKNDYCEYKRENVPLLATHPLEWKLHSTYMFNIGILSYSAPHEKPSHNTTLLYDVDHWCKLLHYDFHLIPLAQKIFDDFNREIVQRGLYSMLIASEIISKLIIKYQLNVLEQDEVLLLEYGLCLAAQNNFQKIFNDDFQDVLTRIVNDPPLSHYEAKIQRLIQSTRDNFEQCSWLDFFRKVNEIPNSLSINFPGHLKRMYRVCRLNKQHANYFGIAAEDLHASPAASALDPLASFAPPLPIPLGINPASASFAPFGIASALLPPTPVFRTLGCEPPPGSKIGESQNTIVP
jgi:hypothetical protein